MGANPMHVIKQYSNNFRPLADMGTKMVSQLKSFMDSELSGDFNLVSTAERSLGVSYFGYRVDFRVEINFRRIIGGPETVVAKLSAYNIKHDIDPSGAQKEISLASCEFDRLGNVTRHIGANVQKHLVGDFASWFMFDVYEAAANNGMTLRP